MNIINLLVLSFLIEAICENIKMIWQDGKVNTDRIISLCVGIIFSVTANIDLLSLLGLELSVPFLGMVATGFLASRGANFMHDFLRKIGEITNRNI